MRRRFALASLALALLGFLFAAIWTICDWPPPRFLLRYGLTPSCEPTGRTLTVEGATFVEIGPGCFRMGSTHMAGGDLLGRICGPLGLPWGVKPWQTDEMPLRWIESPRGFWIAETEITNAVYERFDPKHERKQFSPGDDHPVVDVSWDDAKRYCAWLAKKSGLPVRLPSEAEWEAACRGGSRREFCFGDEEEGLAEYSWFDANANGGAHEVASRRANAWGLYDLHGNLWEWCEDTYHASYEGAPADGSAWTEGGEEWEGTPSRVFRGGSWDNPAVHCRSAGRNWIDPGFLSGYLGFRPSILTFRGSMTRFLPVFAAPHRRRR